MYERHTRLLRSNPAQPAQVLELALAVRQGEPGRQPDVPRDDLVDQPIKGSGPDGGEHLRKVVSPWTEMTILKHI